MFPQRARSWVVEFQYKNRVYRNTKICPSNLFNVLLYIPCLWFLPVSAYRYSSFLSPPPLVRCRHRRWLFAWYVQSLLLPPYPSHPYPRLPYRLLSEVQNHLCRDVMCDCIMPLWERWPHLLKPRLLHCCIQWWVLPSPILPSLRLHLCNPPGDPVLENHHDPSHVGDQHPRLRPK